MSLRHALKTMICSYEIHIFSSALFSCAPGFYGNPATPGGKCQRCVCGGNMDMSKPGSCDNVTGVCYNCANNTEGQYCERCKPGFFGSAMNGDCRRKYSYLFYKLCIAYIDIISWNIKYVAVFENPLNFQNLFAFTLWETSDNTPLLDFVMELKQFLCSWRNDKIK